MAVSSIWETFPGLPRDALDEALEPYGLGSSSSVVDLLSLGGTTTLVLEAISEWAIDYAPDTRLRRLAPSVTNGGDQLVPLDALTTRPANGLRRGRIQTWTALARRSPGELLQLPALGRKSVVEILGLAFHRAATQQLATPAVLEKSPADEADDASHTETVAVPSRETVTLPGLGVLARWAISVEQVGTVGEALDLAAVRPLPADVANALESLRGTRLETVSTHHSVGDAYEALWSSCGDERQRAVLSQRLAFDGPTLEDLAHQMGVTRERVRQIQKAAEDNLTAALGQDACAEIRWIVSELRDELGTAARLDSEAVRRAISQAVRGLPPKHRDTAVAVLIWLAGPYRLDRQTGWIYAERQYLLGEVGPRTDLGPPPSRSLLDEITGEDGIVDHEQASARAMGAGLTAAAVEDWLAASPLRELNGTLVRWHGSVADNAEVVLSVLGHAATADELNELIAEGHSGRGLRNRLLEDERFVRTDRTRIGLRRWGLEEYTGIVDEIEQEIERQGGDAAVDDLVRALTQQFELKASSVLSYTAAPRFVVDGNRIRVRRSGEPFVPTKTLWDEPAAFQFDDDRCSYRWRVDVDLLRGSGRPLPQGVGAWLGVLPGSRRQFHFPDGDTLLVSWPDSALLGPAVGSLRRQALRLEAQDGDLMIVVFNRVTDEAVASVIQPADLERVTGWRRSSLLTGIEAGDESEFEQLLALALNASSSAELRRRLRERGEQDLAPLASPQHSSDLDEALDRLKELF